MKKLRKNKLVYHNNIVFYSNNQSTASYIPSPVIAQHLLANHFLSWNNSCNESASTISATEALFGKSLLLNNNKNGIYEKLLSAASLNASPLVVVLVLVINIADHSSIY